MRRTMPYDNVEERALSTDCSIELPEHREARLELVWQYALCVLDAPTRAVLQGRLVSGYSFREIGIQQGLHEDQARYIYNNAIKKLRRKLGDLP